MALAYISSILKINEIDPKTTKFTEFYKKNLEYTKSNDVMYSICALGSLFHQYVTPKSSDECNVVRKIFGKDRICSTIHFKKFDTAKNKFIASKKSVERTNIKEVLFYEFLFILEFFNSQNKDITLMNIIDDIKRHIQNVKCANQVPSSQKISRKYEQYR